MMTTAIKQPALLPALLLANFALSGCNGSDSQAQTDTQQPINSDEQILAQQPTSMADYFCGGDTFGFRADGVMSSPVDSTYTVIGGLVTISTPDGDRIGLIDGTDLVGHNLGCYFLSGEVLPTNDLQHNDPVFMCDGETYRLVPTGDLAADNNSYPTIVGGWIRQGDTISLGRTDTSSRDFNVIDGRLDTCEYISGPPL